MVHNKYTTVKIPLDKFNESQNYIGETNGTIDQDKLELKVLANLSVAAVHNRHISSDANFMIFSSIDNYNAFKKSAVLGVMAQGGTVDNYPMWVELTDAELDELVPAIPGYEYTDEEGAVQNRTWREWAEVYGRLIQTLQSGNSAIQLSDGKKNFGSDEFSVLHTLGYDLLDKVELLAALPVVSPE